MRKGLEGVTSVVRRPVYNMRAQYLMCTRPDGKRDEGNTRNEPGGTGHPRARGGILGCNQLHFLPRSDSPALL